MAQLIAFLIGVITSTTTSLGDKTNAALRMVGLGHQQDIPAGYESLVPASATTGSTGGTSAGMPVQAPAVDHGLIGNWAHAMASDHPILTLVLAVLIGLYVLYKVRQVAAVLAPRRRTNPQRALHYSHGARSRLRKD